MTHWDPDQDAERAARIEAHFKAREPDPDLTYPYRPDPRPASLPVVPMPLSLPSPVWRVRVILWGVAACVLLIVGLPIMLGPMERPEDPYLAALIAAHSRHRVEMEHMRDSLKIVAASARIVYRSDRQRVLRRIAALPPATIVGDSITLPAGTFVVALPVAQYIDSLRAIVEAVPPILARADTAIRLTEVAGTASDSVTAASQVETADQRTLAEERQPGFLGRVWAKTRVPLAFVGGVVVTVLVRR